MKEKKYTNENCVSLENILVGRPPIHNHNDQTNDGCDKTTAYGNRSAYKKRRYHLHDKHHRASAAYQQKYKSNNHQHIHVSLLSLYKANIYRIITSI